MITTILAIYFGVGLVFVAGVMAAAKRPVPPMESDHVCGLPSGEDTDAAGSESWREAA